MILTPPTPTPKPPTTDEIIGGSGCLGAIAGAVLCGCTAGIWAAVSTGFFASLIIAPLAGILGATVGGIAGAWIVHRAIQKKGAAKS